MSSAVVLQVGDSLVSEIGATGPFLAWAAAQSPPYVPPSFTPARYWTYGLIKQLENPPPLMVTVIPNSISLNIRKTRGLREYHYLYDVTIESLTADQTNASLDPFGVLAEKLADYFGQGKALASFAGPQAAVPIGAIVDPLLYPDRLESFFLFTSTVQVTMLLERKNP